MGTHSAVRMAVSATLVLAASLTRAGEPVDVEALAKQMQELRRKHAACFNKLREIEDKINASPAVEPLRKARKEAYEAYQAKLKADPALAAATKAHDEA
ncbi:MAG: hypothetical protein FJ290_26590 [Planctomycetes bacterium]|nr:hypothetical protein [Planctomycetota bacterium]